MKTKQLLLTGFLLLIALSISASVTILPNDPNIQYIGRFNKTNPLAPTITWTGDAIKINFQGTSLKVKISSWAANKYYVTIDGITNFFTFTDNSGSSYTYTLCSGLTDGNHTATIFKRNNPEQPQTFYGFLLDDGKTLLPPPDRKTRKIEFYGDSQTLGAQVEVPGLGPDISSGYDNNYYSYDAITARALKAEYTCVAKNGATLTTKSTNNIPSVYDRVGADTSSPLWDFSWIGDVVCVNLGVNDDYTLPTDFTSTYITFVQRIRANNPNAYIFLLAGPLGTSSSLKNAIKATVTTMNTTYGDSKVYYYAFTTQITHSGHPRTAENVACAKELVAQIKSVIWSETIPNLSVEDTYITPIPIPLNVGSTEQLYSTVSPFDAIDKVVSWTSSNEAVLKVNSTGLVTAIGAGTANITATSHDSNKSFTVSITVSGPNGLLTLKKEDNMIQLYPNPLTGVILNLNSTGITGEKSVSIFDVTGKMVFSQKIQNSDSQAINLSNANLKGSYIAKISNDKFSQSQLLIIQ